MRSQIRQLSSRKAPVQHLGSQLHYTSSKLRGSHSPAASCALQSKHSTHAATEQQQLPPTDESITGQALSRRQFVAFGCACCLSLHQLQPAAADSGHFSYEGAEGPSHWPGTCSGGLQQSPINLTLSGTGCDSRSRPTFRYQLSSSATVKNTGTTLQVNLLPGNTVSWAGQQLELLQYHFHTPSEHTVEGSHTAMEAHLVHRNTQTGSLAVLAVLLEAPPAGQQQPAANPCLAAGLAAVPAAAGDTAPLPSAVNPADLLPAEPALQQYVSYRGSLTTPPCSEGVDWLVWMQPLAVPQQQVAAFVRFAGMNARPLQALNQRMVASNCVTQA